MVMAWWILAAILAVVIVIVAVVMKALHDLASDIDRYMDDE